jgi:hypothetical protein
MPQSLVTVTYHRHGTSNPRSQQRRLVADIRRQTQIAYAELGGASWQVARDYPFEEVIKPSTRQFIARLKQTLDPFDIMNPGVLGHG